MEGITEIVNRTVNKRKNASTVRVNWRLLYSFDRTRCSILCTMGSPNELTAGVKLNTLPIQRIVALDCNSMFLSLFQSCKTPQLIALTWSTHNFKFYAYQHVMWSTAYKTYLGIVSATSYPAQKFSSMSILESCS